MISENLHSNLENAPQTLWMLDDCLANLNNIYPRFNVEYAAKMGELWLAVIWDSPECGPAVFSKLERAWLIAEANLVKWQIQKADAIATAANNNHYQESGRVHETASKNIAKIKGS